MANLTEVINWETGVYQLETTDPVLGGPDGIDNLQAKQLANRTQYLKKHVDDLEAGTTVPPGIATQAWVNDLVEQRDWKQSVRVATTGNITLSGAQTLDGVSVTTGDRVLVKNQTTPTDNGIYVASASAWTRAIDADESSDVTAGLTVFVSEGTLQADTIWKLTTNDPIVLGTTSLSFVDITNGYAPLASPNFTGNPSAPTAAQFDNDTSLATTEFVQRALGNVAGQVNVTSNITLNASDVGKRINLNSAGIQVYLPPLAQVPVGSVYWVHASAAGTIFKQGANTMLAGGSAVSNIALAAGEFAIFIAGDSNWNVEGGDVELQYSPRFGSSLVSSGYQKLPSGIILQWGNVSVTAGAQSTVTLPLAFPSTVLSIFTGTNGNNASASKYSEVFIVSPGQIKISVNSGTATIWWLAIGV